jgi:hypothetical protein
MGGVNAITPVGGGDVSDLPASMQQSAGMCQFAVGGATLGLMLIEQGPGALQKLKDASKALSREPVLAAAAADGRTVAVAGEEVSAAERTPSVFKATGRGSGGQPPATSKGGRTSAQAATSKPGRAPWRITKEGTERVVEHPRFGKFYKSKCDGLWWSKDRAGHGSQGRPQWKVFEETADGLEWKADADEFGDFITDKHKGPVGLQVPWSEVGGR